jgi:hypothetical protein
MRKSTAPQPSLDPERRRRALSAYAHLEMAKTWILDTETKGTGAEMVPLEKVLRDPGDAREPELARVKLGAEPRPEAPAQERRPPRFRVVEIVSRRVLAEGADTRATVALLHDVRSSVDVNISVWHPETESWRLLGLDEKRLLFSLRDRSR